MEFVSFQICSERILWWFHCRGHRLDPGQATKIFTCHAAKAKKRKRKKKKTLFYHEHTKISIKWATIYEHMLCSRIKFHFLIVSA